MKAKTIHFKTKRFRTGKRKVTEADIDLIRELSKDHYVKEIAKQIDMSELNVSRLQRQYGMEAKRKYKRREEKPERQDTSNEFFNVDKYAKKYLI
jgi:hypothetical protein